MKARYLTFFSYIGTTFRTDGGVHALNSSAHFDLDWYGSKVYDPHQITFNLNKHFLKTEAPICIKDCVRVSDNFHARFIAISRTYLYRFAVLKKDIVLPEYSSIAQHIPIEEWRRCYFFSQFQLAEITWLMLRQRHYFVNNHTLIDFTTKFRTCHSSCILQRAPEFDVNRFKEGCKYFVGYHDFTTFKRFDKLKQHKHNRREIKHIVVRQGTPLVASYPRDNAWDYWDVEIKARAIVHNQIRRMMGTLLAVAVGKLPAAEIRLMLQVPSKHSWHNFIQNFPPQGLYLCNVRL